ncbi:GTP cyclohydrolase II [Epibacterium ulvae]|uniref:GTP cyclohydrolase II n=1 Tax=Epibacterium ulvae TaxID=1156985 RepID=UPI002491BF52|nr:GTP cyclohydrolase II [Epibacterium ulvae]
MNCGNCENCAAPLGVKVEVSIQLDKGLTGRFVGFSGMPDGKDHIAILFGSQNPDTVPVVRIHSECLTGDVFGSQRCDCGPQLNEAIETISKEGGAILYLRQEGRGIGIFSKLESYLLQDKGYDTYEANELLHYPHDMRDYSIAAEMLKSIGMPKIRLLTNNPTKITGLREHGIEIVERLGTSLFIRDQNKTYLRAKRVKGRHLLSEKL